MGIVWAKASPVGGWMPFYLTSSIRQILRFMIYLSELGWLWLKVLFVLIGTASGFTAFRIQPSTSRSSVKQDIHLLRGIPEPQFPFISHILYVHKINTCWLLTSLGEHISLVQRRIKSLGQRSEEFVRDFINLEKLVGAVSFLNINRYHLLFSLT